MCLFQEAGGKRVGESRGAGPRPFSGWAGVPAVGPPGSWGWLAPRELMASWRCQSRLFQGQFGKTQFGDLEGGPGLVGRGKGEMGGGSNQVFTASRALAAPQKGASGRLRDHWTRGCSFVAGKQEGRLEAGTGLVIQNRLLSDLEERQREEGSHHADPPIPTPAADVTNQA